MDDDSFLHIDDISEANREKLLQMRQTMLASLTRNAAQEERKGMYLITLAIFTEFERLTQHITQPNLIKS